MRWIIKFNTVTRTNMNIKVALRVLDINEGMLTSCSHYRTVLSIQRATRIGCRKSTTTNRSHNFFLRASLNNFLSLAQPLFRQQPPILVLLLRLCLPVILPYVHLPLLMLRISQPPCLFHFFGTTDHWDVVYSCVYLRSIDQKMCARTFGK